MTSFDLSECYSNLNQRDLLRIIHKMISRAFSEKPYLAINAYATLDGQKTGRWIPDRDTKHHNEFAYDAYSLFQDVKFLVTNAYIEWLDRAWRQTEGISMGLGISPFLCDYYLLYWEMQ